MKEERGQINAGMGEEVFIKQFFGKYKSLCYWGRQLNYNRQGIDRARPEAPRGSVLA